MFDQLIVSGCSFAYNANWAHVLQQELKIKKCYNYALPGAGNYHIGQSIIWSLDTNKYDPNNTLVIVMWSGNDRDDSIVSTESINKEYPWTFYYTDNVVTGLTGGSSAQSFGNTKLEHGFKKIQQLKSKESRAVENYLHISSLYNYLQNNNYKFLFLNYLDNKLPNRTEDFSIEKFLPKQLQINLKEMIPQDIETVYSWCLRHNMLTDDDFHASGEGQLKWAKEVLLPYLTTNFNTV
jgi:hypothetical protein